MEGLRVFGEAIVQDVDLGYCEDRGLCTRGTRGGIQLSSKP